MASHGTNDRPRLPARSHACPRGRAARRLNNVLTPAFWFFVFDNNRAPVEFVLEMIRTVEPTAVKEIAAMLDKTGQLQQLVLRQQWALQSPAHAIWFRFWTEMWDSNRDALVWGDDDGHHEEGDQGDKAKKANNASKASEGSGARRCGDPC